MNNLQQAAGKQLCFMSVLLNIEKIVWEDYSNEYV